MSFAHDNQLTHLRECNASTLQRLHGSGCVYGCVYDVGDPVDGNDPDSAIGLIQLVEIRSNVT